MSDLSELVRKVEGLSLKPYVCPAGYWTIGYGHLCRADTPEITLAQAEVLLEKDLAIARFNTQRLCPNLSGRRLDAITDFDFNLGAGRLRASTLRRRIRDGEMDAVPFELRKWIFGGGRKLHGLVIRRELEVALWNS